MDCQDLNVNGDFISFAQKTLSNKRVLDYKISTHINMPFFSLWKVPLLWKLLRRAALGFQTNYFHCQVTAGVRWRDVGGKIEFYIFPHSTLVMANTWASQAMLSTSRVRAAPHHEVSLFFKSDVMVEWFVEVFTFPFPPMEREFPKIFCSVFMIH